MPGCVSGVPALINPAFAWSTGLTDILAGSGKWRLAMFLGWRDVRQRYRRSILGPFWITISIAVGITAISFVFGRIFKQSTVELLPYLSLGIILWTFILATVTEGCTSFTAEEAMIKQFPLPLSLHVVRVVIRNLIILAHNMIIIPIVFLACGRALPLTAMLGMVGLLILAASLCWVVLTLAILCARYRDITQIVSNISQILFYVTPVIWMPPLIGDGSQHWIFTLNPAFHYIEIVRAPLLGADASWVSWGFTLAALVLGWLAAIAFFGRFRSRIVYWL